MITSAAVASPQMKVPRHETPGHETPGLKTPRLAAARDPALDRLRLPARVSDIARSLALARRFGAPPEGQLDGCEIWRHHPKGQP